MHQGARERRIVANGLSHHVIEWGPEGARDVVVLCHGFLDLGWGFVTLGPALAARGFRAIAFDFRGHGETDWVGAGGYYHFPDYVLDLHELAPQLCDGPFHLVGHSMGGTVSCLFAATHPALVRTLTLLEGLGPPDEVGPAPQRMAAWLSGVDEVRRERAPSRLSDVAHAAARLQRRNPTMPADLAHFLAEKGTRAHEGGTERVWRFDPLHRTRSPAPFDRARFGQFLAEIVAPTLLVRGEHGLRSGDDDARGALVRRARGETIAGAGHMMHWTHADETARLVLAQLG